MGTDEESRKAEQDPDRTGRTSVAAKGSASGDHRDQQRQASDAGEDTQIATEGMLGEVLD